MSVCMVLLAAGSGRRMQAADNKILLRIAGKTLLEHCLQAIEKSGAADEVVLVVRECDEVRMAELTRSFPLPIRFVYGGAERQDSVMNALRVISENTEVIAVHDAARCLASPKLIADCIESAKEHGSGVAGRRVYDTVKRVDGDHIVDTLDRSELVMIETPQCFRTELLKKAYAKAYEDGFYGTDDAMLCERIGEQPKLVLSEEVNIKMTDPRDMEYGAYLMQQKKENRIGQGYDAHRFAEGRKLILGGVEIPSERGLLGHSDADVLTHAVMDALLGAAALGDIGKHFPDTDERYRGSSSIELLKCVGKLLAESGAEIVNIDATLIMQAPKIAPYREQMKENISAALGIDVSRVSVKATTTEKMGFEGREEGASSLSTCLIRL